MPILFTPRFINSVNSVLTDRNSEKGDTDEYIKILKYFDLRVLIFIYRHSLHSDIIIEQPRRKRAIGTLKFIRADGHRPFGQAMKQLLPTGWRTEIARDVRLPARISWSGNDQWNHVIEKTLPRYSLKATFDTSGKRVLIQQAEKTVKSGLFSAPSPVSKKQKHVILSRE